MNTNQTQFDRPVCTQIDPQSTQPGQLMPTQPIELYHPSSWLKNGDSPAEIILATAFLISAIAKLFTVFWSSKKR
jgi:hypothetical protein